MASRSASMSVGSHSPMPSPRGRAWSVGSVESSSGYESAADEPIHIARALLVLNQSEAHDIIPLAKCLRGYHVEMVCSKDVVAVLQREGVRAIELSQYINDGSPDDPALVIHPRVLAGIMAPRGLATRRGQSGGGQRLPVVVDWSSTGSNCSGTSGRGEEGKLLSIVPSPRPRPHIDAVVLGFPPLHEGDALVPGLAESIDMERIDVLRLAARNLRHCIVCSRPSHCQLLIEDMASHNGSSTLSLRTRLAAHAFELSAAYERAVAASLAAQIGLPPPVVNRQSRCLLDIKHGQNPHQSPAALLNIHRRGQTSPVSIINGSPGYNTLMEALHGWQLVSEVSCTLSSPCCASYKSGSVVGLAIDMPLTADEARCYGVHGQRQQLPPLGVALVRARNADPIVSHCDVVILSEAVDVATAKIIAKGHSVGAVAPHFTDEAKAVLCHRRGGNFILIQVHSGVRVPSLEFREVGGIALAQMKSPNFDPFLMKNVQWSTVDASPSAVVARDMTLCAIALKHTPSASAAVGVNGAVIGLACSQPSAEAALQIAKRKLQNWWTRQHPTTLSLPFRPDVGSNDRINLSTQYASGDMEDGSAEHTMWSSSSFAEGCSPPESLSVTQRKQHMDSLRSMLKVACVACSSACWTDDAAEELKMREVAGAARVVNQMGVTHFGLPDVGEGALAAAEAAARDGGIVLVALGQALANA
jgi:AICAR transformylase/IMP cyclohydrolase PurH